MKLKKIKSLCTLALTVALCTGVLAGCGGGDKGTSSGGPAKQELTYNIGAVVKTIDPTLNNSVDGSTVIGNTFEGLYRLDENDKPIPGVAESHTVSEDGKTYTFKIRENAKWSDGQAVTAKDFKFSWMRAIDKKTAAEYAYQLFYIDNAEEYYNGKAKAEDVGIKVVDERTLEVKLKTATPYFLGLMAFPTYMPLREDKVGKDDAWTKSPETFVTNGPFKMTDFKMKDKYEFVKNENYWNKDAVKLEKLTMKMATDATTSYTTLKQGEFDVIAVVPTEMIDSGKKEGLVQTFENLGTYFVCFNLNNNADKLNADVKKALSNKDFRKALALAIDRDYIVTNVTKTGQVPSASFTPAGIKDPAGKDFKKNSFNPAKEDNEKNLEEAKKLLEQAGYKDGKGLPKFELMYNSEGEHKKIMEVIQQNWKKIGVEVELVNQEWATFLTTRNAGKFQIARHGWSADYVDPMTFLDMWLSGKDGQQATWGNNDSHFKNAEYDTIIKQAKVEQDETKRFELMRKAEDILLEEMPIIPIYDYTKTYGVNKNVKGLDPSSLGQIYFDKAYIE